MARMYPQELMDIEKSFECIRSTTDVWMEGKLNDKEMAVAADLGFNVTNNLNSVRVEGENKPGIAAELTEKLADAGINLRGLSVAVIGARFILYLGLDTADEAAKAIDILQQL